MRIPLIFPLLVIAGCAQQVQVPASQVASIDLCRYMLKGGRDAVVAEAEAQRRGFDCAPYMDAIARQDAARAAAAAAFISGSAFRPAQLPAPPPIGPQRNCTSRVRGNTVDTSCW